MDCGYVYIRLLVAANGLFVGLIGCVLECKTILNT